MKKLVLLPALAAATASTTLSTTAASANPRVLPFTYTTDTLAPGTAELEQTVDLVPLVGLDPSTGLPGYYLASAFQTELELGVAERLELALYITYQPTISPELIANQAKLFDANGAKQRLRYTFAPAGAWPVDVGVYGELSENEREVEVEGKLLLERRFGRLRVAANLWAEYELYFARDPATGEHQRDVVLNPTLGASYELSPKVHLGIDSWLRGEYPTNPAPATRTFGLGPAYYVGPAIMASFAKVWWTVGAYGRVTDTGHELAPGEPYGKVWFRTMIGYDL
ncbi:MAG TPA: hypothetical protein VHE35_30560 [Kofleriaceae bacterium]|nr:hypothetical protein [Kofleriaceae bacterium]